MVMSRSIRQASSCRRRLRNRRKQLHRTRTRPQSAVDFFTQLGDAVANSPIPNRLPGLSGTPLDRSPRMGCSAGRCQIASTSFLPTARSKSSICSRRLGSPRRVSMLPAGWGKVQQAALQTGYVLGQDTLLAFVNAAAAKSSTNYWGIVNDPVGTYPSNAKGYLFRSVIVVEGGVANLALDAVYPTLTGNPSPLDGNHTYKLTFTPQELLRSDAAGQRNLSADGQRREQAIQKASGRFMSTQPIQLKPTHRSLPRPVC